MHKPSAFAAILLASLGAVACFSAFSFRSSVSASAALPDDAPKAAEPAKPASDPAKPDSDSAKPGAGAAAKDAPTAEATKKRPEQDPAKGSIEGRVTFEGPVPDVKGPVVPESHQDHAACAAHVKQEKLIFSDKKELQDVVVSVANYKPAAKPEPGEIQLENKGCTFFPHVQATVVGSVLKIKNSDAFLHNTHGNLAAQFNVAVGPGQTVEKKLPRDGWVPVTCDFHNWMQAHIKVFAHDLFDVTAKDGTFRIANVPPGEYDIDFWHEFPVAAGKQKIKVEAGKATRLDIALKAVELKK